MSAAKSPKPQSLLYTFLSITCVQLVRYREPWPGYHIHIIFLPPAEKAIHFYQMTSAIILSLTLLLPPDAPFQSMPSVFNSYPFRIDGFSILEIHPPWLPKYFDNYFTIIFSSSSHSWSYVIIYHDP